MANDARSQKRCREAVARKERYLVGLDVGTSKVTAVVGEMLDGEASTSSGSAWPSRAASAAALSNNLVSAADSIKKAIDEAER